MQHSSTATLHLSPTGALMDPDYLRNALRPSIAEHDVGLMISKVALGGCALALLSIAFTMATHVG